MPNCRSRHTSRSCTEQAHATSYSPRRPCSVSRPFALGDRNSLASIVRAHEAAKATGVRLVVGCRLDLAGGMSLLV